MNERERQVRYVAHHVIAHPMLVLWPRVGAWLHDVTEPCPNPPPGPSTSAPDHIPTGPVFVTELNAGDTVWMWGDFQTVKNVWILGNEARVTFVGDTCICVTTDTLVEVLTAGHPAGGHR